MASCFPQIHRVPGLLWPKDVWMVDLSQVSLGRGQQAAEGVSPLPRGPSVFALLHLSLPPVPARTLLFSPKSSSGPAWAGVQPAVPGVTGRALRPGGR